MNNQELDIGITWDFDNIDTHTWIDENTDIVNLKLRIRGKKGTNRYKKGFLFKMTKEWLEHLPQIAEAEAYPERQLPTPSKVTMEKDNS